MSGPMRSSGDLFLCCCWVANLESLDMVKEACAWCIDEKYLRRDGYAMVNRDDLSRKIANRYDRSCRSNCKIVSISRNFKVVNDAGTIIYDPLGPLRLSG